MFIVHHRKIIKNNSKYNSIDKITKLNSNNLIKGYLYLKIDLIIGVDNGGDSLTGGIDYIDNFNLARDKQVLFSMKNYFNKYNIPYYHIIFGPGSDGESTKEQFIKIFNNIDGCYMGYFNLYDNNILMNTFKRYKTKLNDNKTVNIMYNNSVNWDDMSNDYQLIIIPRHNQPKIPKKFLASCWVFSNQCLTH